MNFIERRNQMPTVKVRPTSHPIVYITELALNKMFILTKEIATEVGWLGTAKRQDNQFLIQDVFLLKQEVHATTTEITPEGLTAFAEEILAQPNGLELWNDIKMWGHSHVNMGITPSQQDNSQMEVFSQSGHDFFIRLICNKKGELAVDVYDFESGMEFHNARWQILQEAKTQREIDLAEMMAEMEKKYQELQKEKEEIKQGQVKELEVGVKEEIKTKVKKFVTPVYSRPMNGKGYYASSVFNDLIDGVTVTVKSLFTPKEIFNIATKAFTAYEVKLILDEEYPELKATYNDAVQVFNYGKKMGYSAKR